MVTQKNINALLEDAQNSADTAQRESALQEAYDRIMKNELSGVLEETLYSQLFSPIQDKALTLLLNMYTETKNYAGLETVATFANNTCLTENNQSKIKDALFNFYVNEGDYPKLIEMRNSSDVPEDKARFQKGADAAARKLMQHISENPDDNYWGLHILAGIGEWAETVEINGLSAEVKIEAETLFDTQADIAYAKFRENNNFAGAMRTYISNREYERNAHSR